MGTYEILKDAASVLKEAGKIDLYRQILEVQEKLLEFQKRNNELEGENRDLKEKLQTREDLKYERHSYWKGNGDGPFCSQCWDSDKKLVRTHPGGNPAWHTCPTCKNQTQVYPEKDPPQRIIRQRDWY